MSSISVIMGLLLIIISNTSQAARTVNLMNMNDKVVLTNPSTVSVNYDVACFSPSGSQIVNLSNETLIPNATKVYGASVDITSVSNTDACTPGTADFGYFTHVSCGATMQAKACPGSVDFTNASSLCGTGLTLCKYLPGNYYSCAGTNNAFWVDAPTTGLVEISPDSGCTWTSMAATHALMVSERFSCASVAYSQSCRVGGANQVINGCGSDLKTNSHGAICCAKPASSFCRITINSTSVDAFLSSPNFKGGASF
ncbi:MAG: hypothetical protein H6625_03725 [Bdellovibrionaceae bacterium]|nr:hypothetical protein [Pseudobdellovibrionaceae bacterium]